MPIVCKECGHENPDGAQYCEVCGAALEAPQAQGIPQEQNQGQNASATQPAQEQPPQAVEIQQPVAKLLHKSGGGLTGEEFKIVGTEAGVIIGRFDPNKGPVDVDLSNLKEAQYVSRHHAKIYYKADEGKWYVEDMGSLNGTFVNNNRITQPTEIKDNDEVTFGNAKFVFKLS